MKKVFIVLTVCTMVLVLGSCQGNKKCPAYSKNNIEKAEPIRS